MQQVGDFYGSRNRESFDRFQIGMYGFHHNNNHRGHRNFPGQQRPRSRNGNLGNHGDRPGNNRTDERMNRINHTNNRKEKCFICGDFLSNSNEYGVHLCDGGMRGQNQNENREPVAAVEPETPSTSDEVPKSAGEGLEARLEKLLDKIKDTLKNRYESVTETLERYFSDRIDEINNIHREVSEERVALETLKKEIEQKARELEKEEKEIRHKQLQLKKDQEKFDMQTKKEQEEIARRWQQLRDEITRMEEMHESQMVGCRGKRSPIIRPITLSGRWTEYGVDKGMVQGISDQVFHMNYMMLMRRAQRKWFVHILVHILKDR